MPPELEPLDQLTIDEVANLPHLDWATGQTVRLPRPISRRLHCTAHDQIQLDPTIQPPTIDEVQALRLRAAFTNTPPASSRLPFSYRFIPAWLRSWLATRIGTWQQNQQFRWASFPGWPLDLSADFLEDWSCGFGSPWQSKPTPVILSHDLDSAEGLHNLVHKFLPLEEIAGAKSTNFVVPCAWPLDHVLLREVSRRGHELGVHGFDHSNKTAFLNTTQRRERLNRGAELARRYHATGYRAPSLLRTQSLLEDLAPYYLYDSSIPTSGGLFPTPNNGCATARPFHLGNLIELPLSLPRDGSLLFLGHRPEEIDRLWWSCSLRIHASGGVVVLLTHCEDRFSGQPKMLTAYRRFLDTVTADSRFRWCTANEVVTEFVAARQTPAAA